MKQVAKLRIMEESSRKKSKVLGVARITTAIDRDAKDAKEAIVTNEIIDRV